MKLKTTLSILILLFGASTFFAQDIIHFKDGKKVEAKVGKVTSETIEYTFYDRPDGPSFEVNAREISKIKFANGSTYDMDDAPVNDEIFYVDNKRNVVKLHFFQVLTKTTEIGYERVMRPGFSWEGSIGINGLGIDRLRNFDDRGGVYVRLAPKFIKVPKTRKSINRTTHILKGIYFKPELMIGTHSNEFYTFVYDPIDQTYSNKLVKHSTLMGSVNMVGGMQWVLGNAFSIDVFAGLGIGFFTSPETENNSGDEFYSNYYSVASGLSSVGPSGFSATVGLKIGYLF